MSIKIVKNWKRNWASKQNILRMNGANECFVLKVMTHFVMKDPLL